MMGCYETGLPTKRNGKTETSEIEEREREKRGEHEVGLGEHWV